MTWPSPGPCVNCSAMWPRRCDRQDSSRVGNYWRLQGALYHSNAKRLQARLLENSAACSAWTTGGSALWQLLRRKCAAGWNLAQRPTSRSAVLVLE